MTVPVQSIITEDLGMRHMSAKFEPKLLSVSEKDTRVSVAKDLPGCFKNDKNILKTFQKLLNRYNQAFGNIHADF